MLKEIEQDHKKLRRDVNNNTVFAEEIRMLQQKTTFAFNEGWALTKGKYPALERFAGGLSTVIPNTARVESDFSLITMEFTEQRLNLQLASLNGVLHAKQLVELGLVKM